MLLDKTSTGDGIIVALQVLSAMVNNEVSLYELCEDICLLPQVLINISCVGVDNPLGSSMVEKLVKSAEQELSDQGRIVLRYSGTEPYIRIMVEGRCYERIAYLARKIATVIKSEIKLAKMHC